MIVARSYFLALLLLLEPDRRFCSGSARRQFRLHNRTELSAGFDLLYEQRFAEAREAFASWESRNPESLLVRSPSPQLLFEELSRQGVLTAIFS